MIYDDACRVCSVSEVPEIAHDGAVGIIAVTGVKCDGLFGVDGFCRLGEYGNWRSIKHRDVRGSDVGQIVVIGYGQDNGVSSIISIGVGCDLLGAVCSVAEIPEVTDNRAVWIITIRSV